jgi:hypothetical protein
MNQGVSRIMLRLTRIEESDYVPLADQPDSPALDLAMQYWDDIKGGMYLGAPVSALGGYGLFLQGGKAVESLVRSLLVAMVTDSETKVRQGAREPWEHYAQPWNRYSVDNRAQVWTASSIIVLAKEFDDAESRAQYRALTPGMPSPYPCPYLLGMLRLDKIPVNEWGVNEIVELLTERRSKGRLTVISSRLSIRELGDRYGREMQELLQEEFIHKIRKS